MTLKEKVAEVDPKFVATLHKGGIVGCPSDYSYLNKPELTFTNCSSRDCDACWNQPFVEKSVETVEKSELKIKGKRQVIADYCDKNYDIQNGCNKLCKLYQDKNVKNCCGEATDEEIEYNYNVICSDINVLSKYEAALNYLFKKSVEEDAEKDILITLQTALNYAHKKGKV